MAGFEPEALTPAATPETSLNPDVKNHFLAAYRKDFGDHRSINEVNPGTEGERQLHYLTGRVEVWEQVLEELGLKREMYDIRRVEQEKVNSARSRQNR